METATLTSPPRSLMVQPIQKSLSLPSYARAGGEGIDHKIIFAALEQREKVRRKSKIFRDKEKCGTTRQNYFCLPLPSNAKCRETSLSSDTSCSSLEFQKPKCRSSPAKLRNSENGRKLVQNGLNDANKNSPSPTNTKEDTAKDVIIEEAVPKTEHQKLLRVEISKSTIGSSDSMERTERSSKSSNDSLSRKERLEAIKARVEAEREKNLCGSSSEDEVDLRITRHNSDGVIHRTVREVKAKSSRHEKRIRRKTQDEMAIRRTLRKQHTSLYLPPTTDFDLWKPPILRTGSSYSLQRDLDEFSKEFLSSDQKTTLNLGSCSSSFPNHNYFSDICSGSFRSRLTKLTTDQIETEKLENKPKVSNFGRVKLDSALHSENDSLKEYSEKFKNFSHKLRDNYNEGSHLRYRGIDDSSKQCPSPICRAPTPPPRSPKSIEFVNKAFIQHQNATNFLQESRSLERKKNVFRLNLTSANNSEIFDQKLHSSPKTPESPETSYLDRRNRDVINSRRRTLCNFPQAEEIAAVQRPRTPTNNYRGKFPTQNFPPRSPDLSHRLGDANRKTKGYASGSDVSISKTIFQSEIPAKKWEKMELDSEKKFNSLENRSKINMSAWLSDRWPPKRLSPCSCLSTYGCSCGQGEKPCIKVNKKYSEMFQIGPVESTKMKNSVKTETENKISKSMPTSKTPPIPVDRLSKSEANLAKRSPPKTPSPKLKNRPLFPPKAQTKESDEIIFFSRRNASEHLDTAMQELENVYRSLRVSNENLSSVNSNQIENIDRNSKPETSSVSLLRNKLNTDSYQNSLKDSYSVKRTDTNLSTSKLIEHLPKPSSNANRTKPNVRETLCIEELFSDLTQQLDLEQKLLQESKNKKVPNKQKSQEVDCNSSAQELTQTTENPSNTENGDKSNSDLNQKTDSVEEFKASSTFFDVKERLMAQKKREAIGSLSSNLSLLMKSNKVLSDYKRNDVWGAYPHSNKNHEDLHVKLSNDIKKVNAAAESTSVGQKSEEKDEIWQVRVSMNSGSTQTGTNIASPKNDRSTTYSRLRSVLKLPRTDNSREPSPCPSSPYVRERVIADDSELEKMLTNLLSDVPQPKAKVLPSQSEKRVTGEEKPKIVLKGEMLVMKHLDVIRNFDPS